MIRCKKKLKGPNRMNFLEPSPRKHPNGFKQQKVRRNMATRKTANKIRTNMCNGTPERSRTFCSCGTQRTCNMTDIRWWWQEIWDDTLGEFMIYIYIYICIYIYINIKHDQFIDDLRIKFVISKRCFKVPYIMYTPPQFVDFSSLAPLRHRTEQPSASKTSMWTTMASLAREPKRNVQMNQYIN